MAEDKLMDQVKFCNIKMTDLAVLLDISRPLCYKYIEYYDNQQFKSIDSKSLQLFNYIHKTVSIEHNKSLSKNDIMNYIVTVINNPTIEKANKTISPKKANKIKIAALALAGFAGVLATAAVIHSKDSDVLDDLIDDLTDSFK